MSITPSGAPIRPAYIRDSDGLYYKIGGGSGGGLDQATADTRYVNVTGDTITGHLTTANVEVDGNISVLGDAQVAGQTDFLGITTVSAVPSVGIDVVNKTYVDSRTPKIVAQATPPADTSVIWVDTT